MAERSGSPSSGQEAQNFKVSLSLPTASLVQEDDIDAVDTAEVNFSVVVLDKKSLPVSETRYPLSSVSFVFQKNTL